MIRLDRYIPVGSQRLRCGYTTGTCAAAAARGATEALLSGQRPASVTVDTPAGIAVELELEEWASGPGWVSCGVRKDGGDDPDVTDGVLICAQAEVLPEPGIEIDGGPGVGRVTRPGLDQPPGAAAINTTPRRMIKEQIQAVLASAGASHGVRMVISVPEGEKLAGRTFNPRLGIEGGISILGTTGIVRPMSEAALVDSVRLELDMAWAAGGRDVVVTPGNFGETFARETLHLALNCHAQCSNYIGEAIDYAAGLGFSSLLLVGHLGKLIKVAAGSMNTHSRVADGRRECLTAHAALCGAGRDTLVQLFQATTTDAGIEILDEVGLREPVMASIARSLEQMLKQRAGVMETGAIFFSQKYGMLGKTARAEELLGRQAVEV